MIQDRLNQLIKEQTSIIVAESIVCLSSQAALHTLILVVSTGTLLSQLALLLFLMPPAYLYACLYFHV